MTRNVTLVLVDGDGVVLGSLPPFDVEVPYWQEMTDVVRLARLHHGVDLTVLRLLTAARPSPPGGAVTYLAQIDRAVPSALVPTDDATQGLAVADEPQRAAFAEIGGPARSIQWAREVLGPVEAVQQRTWNLSAIWRLRSGSGVAWLKQVPDFLTHESAALDWLSHHAPDLAPHVIAVGSHGRQLLADVDGDDLYTADVATRVRIAQLAHRFQTPAVDACDDLLTRGIPDRRGTTLVDWIRSSLSGWADGHRCADLLLDLDERMAEVAACGVPDTLAHGDAHPGNVRSSGPRSVFLDWGDSFVGHPAFDALRLVDGLSVDDQRVVLDAWATLWEDSVPGSQPRRAVELLRPVSTLRSAAVYADFVARIEPSERGYHRSDVPQLLDAAIQRT